MIWKPSLRGALRSRDRLKLKPQQCRAIGHFLEEKNAAGHRYFRVPVPDRVVGNKLSNNIWGKAEKGSKGQPRGVGGSQRHRTGQEGERTGVSSHLESSMNIEAYGMGGGQLVAWG